MDDKEKIEKLLIAFARAMYAWESKHGPLMDEAFEQEADDVDVRVQEAQRDLHNLFETYCVDSKHPKRQGTTSDPPDYHPNFFTIVDIEVRASSATVKVRQPSLGQKRGELVVMNKMIYTYHIKKTQDGWRLEDRREALFEDSGEVVKTNL